MPPYNNTPPLLSLIGPDTIAVASNTTIPPPVVEVVCAWPVSGQYGFGTRILYYILVATCVLARRTEWLRNACLAAALLLPSVAAIHAVVLAAVQHYTPTALFSLFADLYCSVDTAVDMDIYGAFQICSIGILAAPITVYNSKTYFNDPGRNIIFLWTGLLLAGMLSLTVEFIRIKTHSCSFDNDGTPIDPFDLKAFPYGNANCSLNCVFGSGGPYSPIRQDPTNEPDVIPVPQRLTFGAVILLAAGSSIPPVLTLIFTWEKILEINWKRRFAQEEIESNDPIEGTNGATPKMITIINSTIRNFLSSIHIPLFSGIVVVLLILGELNFWSRPVIHQTEPFSSVGQWANVVATALVVLGSLFYVENQRDANGKEGVNSDRSQSSTTPRGRLSLQSIRNHESIHDESPETASRIMTAPATDTRKIHHDDPIKIQSDDQREVIELETVTTNTTSEPVPLSISNKHRNKVANLLNQFGEYLGTPAPDRYDNTVFREGQTEFPEIPGEAGRVPGFEELRDWYRNTHQQENDGGIVPVLSKVNSFSSMRISEAGPVDRSTSPSRPPSRSNTTPIEQNRDSALELTRVTTSPVTSSGPRPRRDTLEVPNRPRPVYTRPRNSSPSAIRPPAAALNTGGSPQIVVSAEPEEASLTPPTMNTPQISPH
ncbi:hypothetical protein GQX73_g892 [Xylaria multiplex]|uniref:Uncharacterized protein n=1 Tax=Xylaria multiplex TaxID=323545 RepID=A0A7C8J7E7_9PEZI|nr:hypothetical protein GQX73_g892 [Xylaria multiplex]